MLSMGLWRVKPENAKTNHRRKSLATISHDGFEPQRWRVLPSNHKQSHKRLSHQLRTLHAHKERPQTCMHVCTYVYTYVCMCVCMYACMNVCMYACTYIRMYACVCMYVCMRARVCNCTNIYFNANGWLRVLLGLSHILIYNVSLWWEEFCRNVWIRILSSSHTVNA